MPLQKITNGLYSWAYRSRAGCCARCGDSLPLQAHQGCPRKWCSEACRLKAYRARRNAA